LGKTTDIWFSASDDLSLFIRGRININVPEDQRQLSDKDVTWITQLKTEGRMRIKPNWNFFKNGDSREPEIAGILAALVGSILSLSVCFILSFPLGVAAATYLEQFAPKSRLSDVIEVNINNLAAVPSIVFGLLGLSIFLGYFDLPRSSPLVGGLVLSLMTLPTIIIASRASLRSVPPSIKEAALALGATPVQAVFHHVFPVALPGMLTGAIVGMARALGDTAPLLMIGMVAFIVDVPKSILEPATALPVQIFLWADSPERAFSEKTSAAIIVLLLFLILMNLAAVIMRRKFEKRL
jgi:phosphate transport system permease protein